MQANGQNQTLLKTLEVAHVKGKNWREELQTFPLAYRTTPQASTGVTPAFLMFGGELKRPHRYNLDAEQKQT